MSESATDFDSKFSKRGEDRQPPGESPHAKRDAPKDIPADISQFERWKKMRQKSNHADAPITPRKGSAPTQSGAEKPEPEDAPEQNAGEGPDSSKTAAESGETANEESKQNQGELPAWMKKRLDRANKKAEAEQQRNAELRAQLKEAREGSGKGDTKGEEQSAEAGAEYDFDYPDEDDYQDANGNVDESAYLADVRNWQDEKPLVGGKHKDGKQQSKADANSAQKGDETPKAEEQFEATLSAIADAIDESEEAPKNLFNDFIEQVRRGLAQVNYPMMDWIADHEEDAVVLIEEFVKRPRKASNIWRKPISQQGQLLADLAKRLHESRKEAEKEPPLDKPDPKDATNIKDIRSKRKTHNPAKGVAEAGLEKGKFSDFAAARRSKQEGSGTSVARYF